jgi:hypothetical protein
MQELQMLQLPGAIFVAVDCNVVVIGWPKTGRNIVTHGWLAPKDRRKQ